MWGYVGGIIWQLNKKTGLWNRSNKASVYANERLRPMAISNIKGEYMFCLPGGTAITSLTCSKGVYKKWIYPYVPFPIKTNTIIPMDIYLL